MSLNKMKKETLLHHCCAFADRRGIPSCSVSSSASSSQPQSPFYPPARRNCVSSGIVGVCSIYMLVLFTRTLAVAEAWSTSTTRTTTITTPISKLKGTVGITFHFSDLFSVGSSSGGRRSSKSNHVLNFQPRQIEENQEDESIVAPSEVTLGTPTAVSTSAGVVTTQNAKASATGMAGSSSSSGESMAFEHSKMKDVTALKDHFTEGEFKSSDPNVKTTAQLLAALWDMIVKGSELERGEERTTLFPGMESMFRNGDYVEALMGHLDVCKDVCDNFGIHTLLVPKVMATSGSGGRTATVAGFTVKSYKSDRAYNANEEGEYEFEPDPMWDDVDFTPMFDYDAMTKEEEEEEGDRTTDEEGDTAEPLPEVDWTEQDKNDETIIETTKQWVSRMMSDMALCPFTSGANKAGLPMGPVHYTLDRCQTVEEVYRSYWKEVVRVEQASESDLSTTLLILPEFAIHNVEAYENVCNTLTQPMETLEIENLLQLVFFHPQWTFRDGAARGGGEDASITAAANYARRSPWPMINILRTNQVRAAQRGIPTGLVYQQNEKTLKEIGSRDLEIMLRTRDWDALEDRKVNRRDLDALRVAQDFQLKGKISQQDLSLQADTTPAVNKVDRQQVEGGNMINVIRQALAKRLGIPMDESEDGSSSSDPSPGPQLLSGAETSAVMMASDFLIEELDRIIADESASTETK